LTLTGANSYAGDTAINAGTLKFSGSGKFGTTTGALTVDGTLDLGATSQTVGGLYGYAVDATILNNGGGASTLTINTPSLTNYGYFGTIADNNNATAGTVALIKSGTGSLLLTGPNSYSGATNITGGTLAISADTGLGNATGGTTVSSGAQLQMQGVTVSAEPITISGTGVSGAAGALRSTSASTYGGLLKLAAASTIASDSGLLDITNTGTITGAGFGLTLAGAPGGAGEIDSIIGTTTGGVTISGGASWTLTGANTFTGALTISGSSSTLVVPTVNNASTDGPLGHSTTTVTLNSGTLEYTGATASSTKKFTLASYGIFAIDSANT
jgi:autotransporter-associated beta strand protein